MVALITLVLLANLCYSRIGRNWRAVRDDEVAAALAGVNVAVTRVLAFVVSAICAGLAGALLAIVTAWSRPAPSPSTLSIALLTAAVIGGLGSLPGALWGSLLIVIVPTYVTDVATSHGLSSSVGSNIPIAAYGAVLIAVMLAFPQGIQGGLHRSSPSSRARPEDPVLATRPRLTSRRRPTKRRPATREGRHHMKRTHRLRWQVAAVATVAAFTSPPARRARARARAPDRGRAARAPR